MAKGQKKVQVFSDFTGGLNLQSEVQDLDLNEVVDCQDVDFNPHGGFKVRNGFDLVHEHSSFNCDFTSAESYLLGQISLGSDLLIGMYSTTGGMGIFLWDGASLSVTGSQTDDTTQFACHAVWNNKLYFANLWSAGSLVMRRRSGATLSTSTTMGNDWNNDYTAPVGGDMPLARLIANHSGHMWVADTVESATRYRHRVRWSHPLQGEDWAEADYFDIDNYDQSDQITALVPFKDRLMVFKRRSVYAVFGYDRDSFVVERVAGAAGVAAQHGVAVAPDVLYWWSPDGNVMAYNGSQVVAVGDRIKNLYDTGHITSNSVVRVAWADDRLWVSFSTDGAYEGTLVLDPSVGKRGAWTWYSVAVDVVWFRKATGSNQVLCLADGYSGLYDLGNDGIEQDEFTTGVLTPIDAYVKTSWFSGGDPALKKAFKRPHVTAAAKEACELLFDVYTDFNSASSSRTLQLAFAASGGEMVWGASVWGDSWGAAGTQYEFDRIQSAGRGHAVQFKIRMQNNASRWWVDGFSLPYIEKFYR